MSTPSNEKQIVKITIGYGSTAGSEEVLLVHSEDSTDYVGNVRARIPFELATSATDTSFNLASFADTATWIILKDRSGQAFHVALASGQAAGIRHQIAANGVYLYKNANATPPTLYLSNPDGSNKVFGEIIILGASS